MAGWKFPTLSALLTAAAFASFLALSAIFTAQLIYHARRRLALGRCNERRQIWITIQGEPHHYAIMSVISISKAIHIMSASHALLEAERVEAAEAASTSARAKTLVEAKNLCESQMLCCRPSFWSQPSTSPIQPRIGLHTHASSPRWTWGSSVIGNVEVLRRVHGSQLGHLGEDAALPIRRG